MYMLRCFWAFVTRGHVVWIKIRVEDEENSRGYSTAYKDAIITRVARGHVGGVLLANVGLQLVKLTPNGKTEGHDKVREWGFMGIPPSSPL